MKKLIYPACFYPWEDNNGYTVVVPDLKGCVTEGDSLENAIEMAVDVASGWILDEIENNKEIPSPSNIQDIELEYENGFSTYIVLDIDEYERTHSKKSVKKTLSIPNWLNTLAERENINFSQALQESLKSKLNLIK